MNINLNLYKYFYVVAKYLSYTKAAEKLMISQPSLSYSIKTLEEQMNVKLFVRGTKGIELTKDGLELYNKIKPSIEMFESLDNNEKSICGNIVIGTRTMYALKYLPQFTQIINKIYPDLNIIVKIRTIEELYNGLLNNEFDIIIDESNYDENPLIISNIIKNGVTQTGFIVGKPYIEKYKNKILNIDDIKDKIIAVGTNKYTRDFEKEYPDIKIIKVNSTPLLINRLQKEDLIGLTNLTMINTETKEKVVYNIETGIDLPKTYMYISSLKSNDNYKIKKIKDLFINYSSNEIEDIENDR